MQSLRLGVDIPEDHRHVLHETLSQSSIGSPSKLKRSISLRQTNTRGSSTQARSRYSSSTNASPRHDSTSPQHYQHNSNMRFSPSQRPKDFSPNGESDADSLSHALHKMSVSDSRLHVPSSPRATAVCQENSPDYADKEPASASLSTNTRSDDIPYQFLRPTGKVHHIFWVSHNWCGLCLISLSRSQLKWKFSSIFIIFWYCCL